MVIRVYKFSAHGKACRVVEVAATTSCYEFDSVDPGIVSLDVDDGTADGYVAYLTTTVEMLRNVVKAYDALRGR